MTANRTILGLLVAAALGTSGCATVIRGTKQEVRVSSDSPRAVLRVDGSVVDPGPLDLARDEDHHVSAETPGARPVRSVVRHEVSWGFLAVDAVVAVVLFPIGLVAPIVDFADGAIYHLEPDSVGLPAPERAAY